MKRNRGRNRRPGNQNPNRHYESNGPDVKIRGSAQQIFEKYQQFARDAQSAGDRVAAESYLQHAEHYYRIMAATMPRMPVMETDGEGDDDVDLDGDGEGDGEEEGARAPQSSRPFERQNDRGQRQGGQGQNGQNAQGGQGQGQGQGRPRQDRQDRPDRQERQDRPDRGPRGERPDRSERRDRNDRSDRGDRPDRGERPERVERGEAEVVEAIVVVDVDDPLKVVGDAPEVPVGFTPRPVEAVEAGDTAEGERPGRRRRAPYRRRGETDGAEPGGDDDASGVLAIVSRRPVVPVIAPVVATDDSKDEAEQTAG